jgi:hypothetical protein
VKSRRPALGIALLAVAATVAGFGLIAAYFGWQVHSYQAARDRATGVVLGTVLDDKTGETGNIMVRWVDGAQHEHLQRFAIYDTHRYGKGHTFAVAYDPADPSPEGFPFDPDETSAEDDLITSIVIAGLLLGSLVLTWVLRGLLFRRAVGRPGHPMAASALSGRNTTARFVSFGNSTWFGLAEIAKPQTPVYWQRVMWHPDVDAALGHVSVVVHGAPAGRRRVAVELTGGARLVPIGRLRHRPPKRILLAERADTRVDLADSFILPTGTLRPPNRPWLRRSVVFAVAGAVLGAAMGVLVAGGVVLVLSFAVAGSALLVNGWALTGPEP